MSAGIWPPPLHLAGKPLSGLRSSDGLTVQLRRLLPSWLFLLAGVLCDVVYVGVGLFLLSRWRRMSAREFSFILLAGTLLTAFSIRWAVSPVFVMINASDEATMSSLLGLNTWVIPICTLPIGIGIVCYVFSVHVRSQTMIPLITGAFGAFCGLGLWINIVGPILFA